MKLALFDLDGTLTKRDTLWQFLFFVRGRPRIYLSCLVLAPFFFLYAIKVVSGGELKRRLLSYHFKGWTRDQFSESAASFGSQRLNSLLRPDIVAKLEQLRAEGAEICIVSASCDVWLSAIGKNLNVSYLGTELQFEQNVFTGRFATPNCNGPEKLNRVRQRYQLDKFERIVVYGNSRHDLPMMSVAHEHYLV